ncbi:retrovirus-related pol polyprotein from transposon TNT 1-94 [Tanacetum coccineum]
MYCLVVIDDFSRFSWVLFLATKDETSEILKTFITGIENIIDLKVKVIKCNNGTEFKNRVMNQFCEMKGIKREFSIARTPQQNGVAERKIRTLIEAARTILANSKLPTTFWAEVVNTACYVQNRVLVIKPHNKTPYEFFLGRKPALSFMRPFGCPVTILNIIDHLGNGPNWLFDIDALTNSMNYKRVVTGNQSNGNAGTKACADTGKARVETVHDKDYILLPLWTQDPSFSSSPKDSPDAGFKPSGEEEKKDAEDLGNESRNPTKGKDSAVPSTYSTVNDAVTEVNAVDPKTSIELLNDPNMPELEDIVYLDNDEDVGAEVDMNNLDAFMPVSPIPTRRIYKDHSVDQIIRDLNSTPQTRRMTKNLKEHGLDLVDLPNGKRAIGTKWVYKKKKDKRGIVIKKKARLVAQGYTQEEGIYYDEVFAPVARIETIRLFLAYASFKDFVVYQMDVKSAFLYGKIEKEVYVCQPPGFEDPNFPDKVYKVEKALYRLHQAPKAWYETLSTYLLENRFQRGQIDKTLFIKRDQGDILIVQVYVDDIIFGSTKKKLCTEFEKMMHKKFQMSSMGELTFFLGLQVKQKEDGIFISQDKYVTEILKKFGFSDVKTANTPMETHKPLLKDADGEDVDEHMYRSMIGSLMYLTSSRPDIMFVVCVCARFQVNPKVSHLHAVKRIFRYLKGQPKLGLWYPKDSPFDLVAYTDSDYAGASLDRKSTTGGCQFLGCRLISWQCKKQTVVANSTTEAEYVAASSCCGQKGIGVNAGDSMLMLLGINLLLLEKVNAARHNLLLLVFWGTGKVETVNGEVQLHALVDRKKVIITESTIRRDLQLEDAEEPIADEAATEENVPTQSNDPPLSRVNTLGSGEDKLTLKELMDLCTKLSDRVLDLETTKTAQAKEIASLKKRVKKLERKRKSKTPGMKRLFKIGRSAQVVSSEDEGLGDQEDASKQGRKIDDIDKDAEVTLVDETQGRYDDAQMFDTDVFNGEEVFVAEQSEKVVEEVVSTAEVSAAATITTEEITLAQALAELRSAKPKVVVQEPVQSTTTTAPSTIPKAKSITFRDPSESTTRTTLTSIPSNIKDKGKAKMIEPEKPLKMKEQIRLDEELAFKLQAEEEEQARLAREKAEEFEEANISWDNMQAIIEADRLLAERLQAREQKELTDEEKARLFIELLEKRKKHFAALRAQEKRNKPPTKAQK